jgi:hypothetical protein
MKLLIMQSSPVSQIFQVSDILLRTLFSNTLSIFSSIGVRPVFTPIQNWQNYSCSYSSPPYCSFWNVSEKANSGYKREKLSLTSNKIHVD